MRAHHESDTGLEIDSEGMRRRLRLSEWFQCIYHFLDEWSSGAFGECRHRRVESWNEIEMEGRREVVQCIREVFFFFNILISFQRINSSSLTSYFLVSQSDFIAYLVLITMITGPVCMVTECRSESTSTNY